MPLILFWILSSLLVGQALAQDTAGSQHENNGVAQPISPCDVIKDPLARGNCLVNSHTDPGSYSYPPAPEAPPPAPGSGGAQQ
jgi:hypothetical protein